MNEEFNEKLREASKEIQKHNPESPEHWKAVIKRDKIVFSHSRSQLVKEIHSINAKHRKELLALRTYVHEELDTIQDMLTKGISYEHLHAKLETVLNNVLWDEF